MIIQLDIISYVCVLVGGRGCRCVCVCRCLNCGNIVYSQNMKLRFAEDKLLANYCIVEGRVLPRTKENYSHRSGTQCDLESRPSVSWSRHKLTFFYSTFIIVSQSVYRRPTLLEVSLILAEQVHNVTLVLCDVDGYLTMKAGNRKPG